MKKYVYELVNLMGTVEHVGETFYPKKRLSDHCGKNGKFYQRQDISMHIVEEFDDIQKAWDYQCKLQEEYGLITDAQKQSQYFTKKILSPCSEETKLKIKNSKLGKPNGRKGKTHSNEVKEKIRESQRLYWAQKKGSV